MSNKKIILIGGAPTTGKSTIAKSLSKRLNLPYISTDQIRALLRSVASKEQYPELFNSSEFDAERFLTELSAEEIVEMEFRQGEETWAGVRALINDCDYEWKDGCIIEGVGIIPKMVAKDYRDDPHITALFLGDHNISRMRDAIYKRGLWDDAHKYGDHLKEKEVEWVSLYGSRLEVEAKRHGFPCIEIQKNDDDIKRVMSIIEQN